MEKFLSVARPSSRRSLGKDLMRRAQVKGVERLHKSPALGANASDKGSKGPTASPTDQSLDSESCGSGSDTEPPDLSDFLKDVKTPAAKEGIAAYCTATPEQAAVRQYSDEDASTQAYRVVPATPQAASDEHHDDPVSAWQEMMRKMSSGVYAARSMLYAGVDAALEHTEGVFCTMLLVDKEVTRIIDDL